jgi:ABC-2 type transport system ATP-binding protein
MNYAIEAVSVYKSLGNKPILSDITIRVRQGAIYGFLGANGAGKTSFLKILMGLWNMDSGSVALLTHNLKEGHEVYKHIGSIIETPVFYSEFSARKNLEIHCDYLDKNSYEKINSTLQLVGIGEEAAKPVREFSLGMKQRLAIGRALLADPKLLVLDEPINGLDPHGIKFLRELLCKVNRSLGTTIIISSHILDEVAKVADVIGIIHQGKMLAEVPIEAVGKDFGDLEAYYFNLIKEGSNDQAHM